MSALHVLQDVTANAGKVSILYIKLDDPANTKSVIAALQAIPGLHYYLSCRWKNWSPP